MEAEITSLNQNLGLNQPEAANLEAQNTQNRFQRHYNPDEKSSFLTDQILSLTLQGDEEDVKEFKNASDLSLNIANTRLFISTGPTSSFYVHFWNCISIGTTKSGLLLMVSDVVQNEKYERNPNLNNPENEDEEVKSRDSTFEKIANLEGCVELIGEYTLQIEVPAEKKNQIFMKLNQQSGLCLDPPELRELLRPRENLGMFGGGGLGGGLGGFGGFEGFEGGEGWEQIKGALGARDPDSELGKRGAGVFVGGGEEVEVYDLEKELKNLKLEDQTDRGLDGGIDEEEVVEGGNEDGGDQE